MGQTRGQRRAASREAGEWAEPHSQGAQTPTGARNPELWSWLIRLRAEANISEGNGLRLPPGPRGEGTRNVLFLSLQKCFLVSRSSKGKVLTVRWVRLSWGLPLEVTSLQGAPRPPTFLGPSCRAPAPGVRLLLLVSAHRLGLASGPQGGFQKWMDLGKVHLALLTKDFAPT